MCGVRIGTAAWSIPSREAAAFPSGGSHLERYAAVFDAVEINSSFYRHHRRATYARWAASVPPAFRFSVKVPKAVTHERRLIDCDDVLRRFRDEVSELGPKLGPLLVQLPPRLAFSQVLVPALARLRALFPGPVVYEPRHSSWFADDVEGLLAELNLARVVADPSPVPGGVRPGGSRRTCYIRLHGAPRIYWSNYDRATLSDSARTIQAWDHAQEVWIMFDNTAAGAATSNALSMISIMDATRANTNR
jgi:uncharacterized protein YecE (DUF72 family)